MFFKFLREKKLLNALNSLTSTVHFRNYLRFLRTSEAFKASEMALQNYT